MDLVVRKYKITAANDAKETIFTKYETGANEEEALLKVSTKFVGDDAYVYPITLTIEEVTQIEQP